MTSTGVPKGTAPIKPEYLIDLTRPSQVLAVQSLQTETDSIVPEGPLAGKPRLHSETNPEETVIDGDRDAVEEEGVHGPPTKRVKLSGAQRRQAAKERSAGKRKENKGMNKGRRFLRVHDEQEICWKIACGLPCDLGDKCRGSHDVAAYLQIKPPDIHIPISILTVPPFVSPVPTSEDPSTDSTHPFPGCPGASITTRCPYFDELGQCKVGFKCRFLGAHLDLRPPSSSISDPSTGMDVEGEEKEAVKMPDLILRTDPAKIEWAKTNAVEMNGVTSEVLKSLRKRGYPFVRSKRFMEILKANEGESMAFAPKAASSKPVEGEGTAGDAVQESGETNIQSKILERPEKKRLHWKGLTYLAPLTTVGNLVCLLTRNTAYTNLPLPFLHTIYLPQPFRRLCTTLGVDITCGEMGLSHSFLQGSKEEWSLVRRHPSERIFGVQIAGNKAEQTATCADVIGNECNGIDFVDLNAGCPIDLVYQAGSGSALLNVAGKFGKCLMGMNYALDDVPVTVKMRTGVKDNAPTAHKLMPRLHDWGVSSVALHGRTRQQRYTKLADWSYIKTCVTALRQHESQLADSNTGMDADVHARESGASGAGNNGFDPIPFWGNGDCFSGIEYWDTVNATGVDGILAARGALIKPWIFTEIKERREWDISSRERLDLVRKYAEFGLCHFGSDTAGVNTTRRYLCEALSFMHRYVPIGLLEVLPPKLNDRAPAFRGRDELETLLASADSRTWVTISEMFLGPAPPEWTFVPKHKSNSYAGDEEAQG